MITRNNIFVKRYRKILEDLSQNLRGKYEAINRNNNMYSESVAQSYNAEVEKEINSMVDKAKSKVHKVMCDVSVALNQWATVQGRCITKDAELLNGNYPMSTQELCKLVDIYNGNYTMLSAIQRYCDNNNISGVYITPVEKKLLIYEKFYSGALSAIDQIVSRKGNWDSSEYANNALCLPLFDVIGTGAELQDFKMLRLEVQTPIKDYPNPTEQAHFDFHFKPVQRNEQSVNLGI